VNGLRLPAQVKKLYDRWQALNLEIRSSDPSEKRDSGSTYAFKRFLAKEGKIFRLVLEMRFE
jgi:hypothetical protein